MSPAQHLVTREEREKLIAQLDPQRDYGERTYEQVIDAVRKGKLRIDHGQRLPILRDGATGLPVKGTGPPNLPENYEPMVWGLEMFHRWAAQDFLMAYSELRQAMQRLDIRAHKIFWETFVGKPRESRNADASAVLMELLQELSHSREAKVDERYFVEAGVETPDRGEAA